MTLKRREKRRYISLAHDCPSIEAVEAIEKRITELYGTITHKRASVKIMRSVDRFSVLRCNLGYERQLLVAITLSPKPMITLDISSSMRRLKKRLAVKVNTALYADNSRG